MNPVVPNINLADQLQPSELLRVLNKDVQRREVNPGFITAGAQEVNPTITYSTSTGVNMTTLAALFKPFDKKRIIGIPYYANASAGTYTATLTLNLKTVPSVLIWFMGVIPQPGVGASLYSTSGAYAGTRAKLCGKDSLGAAFTTSSSYTISKTNLVLTMVSYNSPEPTALMAYFRYAIFYDDFGVGDIGL